MLLLVQFYTSDLIFLKTGVAQKISERKKFLKINLEKRYNEDNCSRKGETVQKAILKIILFTFNRNSFIDFNIEMFVRHARLWEHHAFSRTDIPEVELQRQVLMFLTMYSMIDEG